MTSNKDRKLNLGTAFRLTIMNQFVEKNLDVKIHNFCKLANTEEIQCLVLINPSLALLLAPSLIPPSLFFPISPSLFFFSVPPSLFLHLLTFFFSTNCLPHYPSSLTGIGGTMISPRCLEYIRIAELVHGIFTLVQSSTVR